jgi:hypothetical protein
MKESVESIWSYYGMQGHVVCITTNGTVKKNGRAVMGRGNAKQAKIMFPDVDELLGQYLRNHGNHAGILALPDTLGDLLVFPVKHRWWEPADLGMITSSVVWLKNEAQGHPETTYHLPRPGCGNGGRDWATEVNPICKILPDNVWLHTLLERTAE